jgi:hypothetical protein
MLSDNRHSAIESNSAFTAKVEDLVKEIVIQNDILYYRIESRVEHVANVGGEDNFMPVIRIITYFEDTVSQISDLLSSEFDIVAESAVDKKKSRVESFSYKHIQYLVCLKANRRELTEYKRSGNKQFEIQICSMLQDAWAGIEKELGYDSASFPEEGKRDLYRVGALLEMADLEFLKIRSKFIIPVTQQPAAVSEPMERVAEKIATPAPVEAAPAPQMRFDPLPAPPPVREVIVNDIPAPPKVTTPEAPAPVYEAPAPVYQAPVYEAPVYQAPPAPVYEAPAPQPAPVAPPPVMQAPAGIAPKAAKIETTEVIPNDFAATAMPSAPAAEHTVEYRAPVAEQPAPVYQAPPAPVYEAPAQAPVYEAPAAPVFQAPPAPVYEAPAAPVFQAPPAPVFEAPAPAPVYEAPAAPVYQAPPAPTQEAPAPAPVYEAPAAPVFQAPPAPVQQTVNIDPLKVNVSGNIEKAPEATADGDSSAPFFEDLLDEQEHMKTVAKAAPLDENAPITDASLKEYVLKSKLLKEIDSNIAERAGARINSDIDIEGDVERLRFLKVYTLKQLHDRLHDNKDDVVAFAEKWIGKDNGGSFDSGISLFYLEYLLVGKKNDPAFAVEYVVKFISDNDYSARYIIPTYNSIRNTEAPNFSHLTLK